MQVAALALEALTGTPQRLLWCVDLERDVGVPPGPVDLRGSAWAGLLDRFKGALDRLPWGPAHCNLALATRTRVRNADGCEACRYDVQGQAEGKPCPKCGVKSLVTFRLPYVVDLGALCRGAPPVGCWRIWPVPARGTDRTPDDTAVPASFFLDAIPF